jgi:cytochrome c peroxidase
MGILSKRSRVLLFCVLGASAPGAACGDEGPPPGPEASPEQIVATKLAGVPAPADNPTTPEKVALGRLLFWDPILSGSRDVSCASCHDPAFAYGDGRAVSVGTGGHRTPRGALTVLDAAWNGWTATVPSPDPALAPMFWDSRARSLEAQARGPITGEGEMRGAAFDEAAIFPEIASRLSEIPEYVTRFEDAFGEAPIDATSIVRAIASFERTLVTVPSYERWLAGDANAISESAKRGASSFRRSGCSRCHSGPMLSDFERHRFTRDGEAIRTPSLRNVLRTAPYMHDGRAATIDAVFDVYRRVDERADPRFRALRVPDRRERADVLAFLQAASDGEYDRSVPSAVPSGLEVGGTRRASDAGRLR